MLFSLVFDPFVRYSCNRYDEKDAQAARDAQAVSTATCIQLSAHLAKAFFPKTIILFFLLEITASLGAVLILL